MRFLILFPALSACDPHTDPKDEDPPAETGRPDDTGPPEDTGADTDTGIPWEDADADGTAAGADCDDTNPNVHPGAEETCDGVDQDCDGEIDEDAVDPKLWYADADGDGHGDASILLEACEQPGRGTAVGDDCNDADPLAWAGASEVCGDGSDNDCDGHTDPEAFFVSDAGSREDWTARFAGGTAAAPSEVTIDEDGTLSFCPGTWYARLTTTATTVDLVGVEGATDTILDAAATGTVLTVSTKLTNLSITGLTLANGWSTDSTGAGIHAKSGSVALSLTESVLQDHTSSAGYAAGLVAVGDVSLVDSTVSGNTCQRLAYTGSVCYGGALFVDGNLYLSGSTLSNNTASNTSYTSLYAGGSAYGGAAYVTGDLDVHSSTISDNATTNVASGSHTYSFGGAIYVGRHATLEDSRVSGNTVSSDLSCDPSTSAYGCILIAEGGGLYVAGSVILTNTLFEANTAVGTWSHDADTAVGGGGLRVGGDLTCYGSSAGDFGFHGNSADEGGGVYWDASAAVSINSDVCDWGEGATDNAGGDIGGAASHDAGEDASFTCVAWGPCR